MADEALFTRRAYLVARVIIESGCLWSQASEAVASVAIEHPEWDLDGELRTWDGWDHAERWHDPATQVVEWAVRGGLAEP